MSGLQQCTAALPGAPSPNAPAAPSCCMRAGQRAHASQVSLMSSCSFGEERQLCSSVTSFCSLRAAGFGVLQTKRQPAGRSHGSVCPPTRAPARAASKDSCGHRKTVGLPARIDAEPPAPAQPAAQTGTTRLVVSPHQPSFPSLGSAPSHGHSKAGPRDDPELLRDKWRLSFHSGYFYISKNKAVLEEQPFQGPACPQLGAGSTQLAAAPGWG